MVSPSGEKEELTQRAPFLHLCCVGGYFLRMCSLTRLSPDLSAHMLSSSLAPIIALFYPLRGEGRKEGSALFPSPLLFTGQKS